MKLAATLKTLFKVLSQYIQYNGNKVLLNLNKPFDQILRSQYNMKGLGILLTLMMNGFFHQVTELFLLDLLPLLLLVNNQLLLPFHFHQAF